MQQSPNRSLIVLLWCIHTSIKKRMKFSFFMLCAKIIILLLHSRPLLLQSHRTKRKNLSKRETRLLLSTRNTQHTTHNTQHTTHNTQHTTHNTQHTTHTTNIQQTHNKHTTNTQQTHNKHNTYNKHTTNTQQTHNKHTTNILTQFCSQQWSAQLHYCLQREVESAQSKSTHLSSSLLIKVRWWWEREWLSQSTDHIIILSLVKQTKSNQLKKQITKKWREWNPIEVPTCLLPQLQQSSLCFPVSHIEPLDLRLIYWVLLSFFTLTLTCLCHQSVEQTKFP